MTGLPPVISAGALCWRLVEGKARVLVVHRGDRADVSLPKGKVDPGETLPQTAVRELAEETGLEICLGAPLGSIGYQLPGGRDKVVHYWSAEVDEHALQLARFVPNNEIASVEWLPIERARKRLTYEHDVSILDRFAERLDAGHARTFAVIVVRHGKAVSPEAWDGPDAARPLLQRGTDQATGITGGLAAFAPEKIISSTAARCVSTVEPVATLLGLPIKQTDSISQDAYSGDAGQVRSLVRKRIRKRSTTVLCSHGPVIPQIIEEVLSSTSSKMNATLRRASTLSTGEFAVLHISRADPTAALVATEVHRSTPG